MLGATIWAHVRVTQQPPIYDALTYYAKAYYFWQKLGKGHLFNPLNLEPTVRPPGTVLMSYPFGFDPDPRGFYFRSIFFPAVLLILAVLTAGYRASSDRLGRWRITSIAVFFSTPPLLYWFAFIPNGPTPSYWGLVDNFMGGVAALAAAAAWRSVTQRSLTWFAITGLTSSFCILIKPSGAVVAALIGMISAFLCLLEHKTGAGMSPLDRADVRRRFFVGLLMIGTMDVLVLAAALSTKYLSRDNIDWGKAAIAVVKADFTAPASVLLANVHWGPGDAFMVWAALAAVVVVLGWLTARRKSVRPLIAPDAAAAAAIAALVVGLCFWVGSGGVQIRYGMPFFMIAMIWMVPSLAHYWERVPRLLTGGITVVMLAASTNLALLLIQRDPPAAWQERAGISLSAGSRFDAMGQFHEFVETPRVLQTTIYSFDADEADQILTSLIVQRALFHPEFPPLVIRRPRDWRRPTTFRVDEMLSSDFLLFHPKADPLSRQNVLVGAPIASFSDEQAEFIAWASDLTPADGIDVVVDSPKARILHVRDNVSLRKSVLRMISRHHWRAIFTDANAEVEQIQSEPR